MTTIGDKLRIKRAKRHMIPALIATFVGITVPGYWDLEAYPEEVNVLDVSQFPRLCVIFEASLQSLLTDETAAGQEKSAPPLAPDAFGHSEIAAYLRNRGADMASVADEIGWEAEFLTKWLTDDCSLGQMPMAALKDFCEPLGVDFVAILTNCWIALGKKAADGVAGYRGHIR